jgi:hypothetical protein
MRVLKFHTGKAREAEIFYSAVIVRFKFDRSGRRRDRRTSPRASHAPKGDHCTLLNVGEDAVELVETVVGHHH